MRPHGVTAAFFGDAPNFLGLTDELAHQVLGRLGHGRKEHGIPHPEHSAVQLEAGHFRCALALADLPFVEAAPCELRPRCFATLAAGLTEGAAAGAIVGRRIVAICHTAARSDRHADLGVFTAEEFRGRGMATAAAALVARRIRQAGQIPVWSAGETNTASLRVAQKVGFVEICRRIYLIPAKD